ncbi:glutamine-hydrolyzing carbamoyl-phosphate synthase small subunit [Opitutales bacterium ASA1]|uniref:glutamine-hydrolyzing carbamoyl-phosphate synthase small subunit n=1 Tax=Congregicoccus parvus TaxID=3081749 RepID=UPI002B30EC25|nr:glutamine-hydrolyzing carbamoyl-phosphate synthase small subunit [Opitutales bacterium ASA1]
MSTRKSGVLALEDGSVFRGLAFGGTRTVTGEAVFNTSMTGYQEVLSDPSYFGQIVTMTAVQVGNYGISPEDEESSGPKVAGFVVRELSSLTSNWRATGSLDEYLRRHDIPGLDEIDTRTLTKKLRVYGAMKACLSTEEISDAEAVRRAREWEGLVGFDYVKEVTCAAPFVWKADDPSNEMYLPTGTTLGRKPRPAKTYRVAAFDLGAKYSIYRKLVRHGFEVHVFPADASPDAVREIKPDGLFLSNGPGDPSALEYVHKTIANLMPDYPTFGICLGHQMVTHALGASTFKLKFGHRGGNQPVKNLETGRVSITSQNHGFASDPDQLADRGAIVTEINLNDGTVEGLRHKELPIFTVQYHPEAAPGPNDADPLFVDFYNLVDARAHGKV